jgi:2-polyprenyl-3-methyl-5-hydroxy-6-metoxy-1,4-benzoquinol methylase
MQDNIVENFERLSEAAGVSMNDKWFEYATKDHFWMQWRFRVIKKVISKIDFSEDRVLEIGCGSGVFKSQMEEDGYIVDGCDLNIEALKLVPKGRGNLYLYDIFDKKNNLTITCSTH